MPKYYPAFLAGRLPDWPTALRFVGVASNGTPVDNALLWRVDTPDDTGRVVARDVALAAAPEGQPEAALWIDDEPNKGVPSSKWLTPEILGGPRNHKRFEKALISGGIMPSGSFAEQGYRANMTAKRKDAIEKRGRSANGYKMIGGAAYFVSNGRGGKRCPFPAVKMKNPARGGAYYDHTEWISARILPCSRWSLK